MPALKHPVMTKSALKDHKIGEYTYGVPKIIGSCKLVIGRYTSISDGVTIIAIDHRMDWGSTYPFPALFASAQHIQGHPTQKGAVNIGHDVWIGQNATIMSGVTIGHGAVIAAQAVVTKDVAPYSMVAGNPAQHKKFRFSEEWVDFFVRKLQWWDWPHDLVLERAEDLCQPPGDHLLKYSTKYKEGGKK